MPTLTQVADLRRQVVALDQDLWRTKQVGVRACARACACVT